MSNKKPLALYNGRITELSETDIIDNNDYKATVTTLANTIALLSTKADKVNIVPYVVDIPSHVWTINHELGVIPVITIVDSSGNIVIGDTQYLDMNTAVITFSGGFSGIAYLTT